MPAKLRTMTEADAPVRPAAAKPKATPPAATKPERTPVLVSPNGMRLAEQAHNTWRISVPAGTLPEDLHMRHGAWAAVAHDLTLGDEITIVTADEKRLMQGVCVYGKRGTLAVVAILVDIELPELNEELRTPPGYSIRRTRGGEEHHGSWVCVRDEDQLIINSGPLHGREDAQLYLVNHPAVRALGTVSRTKEIK